jgi:hypothetical protein
LTCERTLAVNRLRQNLHPTVSFRYLFIQNSSDVIAGKADYRQVSIHRIYGKTGGWTKHNAWQPWLKASFEYMNGQLHLSGKFQIHPFVQIFSGVWLGGILFIALYSFWLFLVGPFEGRQGPVPLSFPLGALAFGFAGLALMHGAWRWSVDDIDHIKRFINEHVGRDASYEVDSNDSG